MTHILQKSVPLYLKMTVKFVKASALQSRIQLDSTGFQQSMKTPQYIDLYHFGKNNILNCNHSVTICNVIVLDTRFAMMYNNNCRTEKEKNEN